MTFPQPTFEDLPSCQCPENQALLLPTWMTTSSSPVLLLGDLHLYDSFAKPSREEFISC